MVFEVQLKKIKDGIDKDSDYDNAKLNAEDLADKIQKLVDKLPDIEKEKWSDTILQIGHLTEHLSNPDPTRPNESQKQNLISIIDSITVI